MSEPYRCYGECKGECKSEGTTPSSTVDVTVEELKFWEQVYTAYIVYNANHGGGDQAAQYADKAIERRRKRFGVR